jgi:hypothetical protein
MITVGGRQENRSPQASGPMYDLSTEDYKTVSPSTSPATVRTRAASPAVAKRKAPRRASGTTAATIKSNKSNKTNKTGNSNATSKTRSSTVSNKTTTSKKKGPPFPPTHSHASPVASKPPHTSSTHAHRPVPSNPSALTGSMALVAAKPSPAPSVNRKKPITGQRAGLEGRSSPPHQNQLVNAAPKPPSFTGTAAITTTNSNASLAGPQYFTKRNSYATTMQQKKAVMRAPPRPTSMITDSINNNNPNRPPANGEQLPPKSKHPIVQCGSPRASRVGPQRKTKSLPVTSTPTSTALVPRQPNRHNLGAAQQPTRTKSLDLEDLVATESDSSGTSGNPSDSATNNPLRDLYNRTRSMMDDLMGSGNSFNDDLTTTMVPSGDSGGGALPPGSACRSSMKQPRRILNQSSDHQSVGRNSYHRQKSLPPPPPNRGASFVPGLGGGSLHGGSNHSMDFLSPASSVLMRAISDEPPFVDDPAWKKPLRFLRLLPPSPKERPINRRIRILIWTSLVLDCICAFVAIATFTQVTTCCGKPIWSLGGNVDWSTAMTVISYIYVVGIFLEVIPVVRESGIPWNIMNPLFGFLLTFAVFFDNSQAEAISMWIFETVAVICDFLVYKAKRQKRMDKEILLDSINEKLEPFFASNRKGNGTTRTVAMDISFHETAINDMEDETVADHREIKLLRDRRHLRHSLAEDQKYLSYHLLGVVFNTGVIIITLIISVTIASTGGMCVYDNNTPNPFSQNQLGLCSACHGVDGTCEICRSDGTSQCYYPY